MQIGDFVELRSRPWLVEAIDPFDSNLRRVSLSCISDDAQGEALTVLWDAEVDPRIINDPGWDAVGLGAPDTPAALAAHLRAIRWNTATSADRDLLQAPFRAGIRLDAYQLLPLRKALRLPRVNLLIADDVGLGKTIEAGLIIRELLLRRRIDLIVVAAPASMTTQWVDELESKFGLGFTIIDRDRLAEIRRTRGFGFNPWRTGSRFIISHSLLADEAYASGLRDVLGEFRSRALFVLDEAHHAAPSGGSKYAISSQFTKSIRDLSERFEHRLFLSATPHNGHSNSFSALLEMLDPQRFTRGVPTNPKDLDPVMVRRLKSDLRKLGEAFPSRRIEAVILQGLGADAPEIKLARMLQDYDALRSIRLSNLPPKKASAAAMVFVGLQQRLLSSVPAFLHTLYVHRKSLEKIITGELRDSGDDTAVSFGAAVSADAVAELSDTEGNLDSLLDLDERAATDAASAVGSVGIALTALQAELGAVDAMIKVAEPFNSRPDTKVQWISNWILANLLNGKSWSNRRLIIFTEYETTRRWLERKIRETIEETDNADERIGVFTGATSQDQRDEIKRAFNTDPDVEPIRILICTDAAREGINLQSYCSDLFHFDLPWNPSRLEQRNGRIDRKLQPAPEVTCRYFVYAERETDVVLDALVKKTERIRQQLGSAGQVIEDRIAMRLQNRGIGRGAAADIARAIEQEEAGDRLVQATSEMDDDQKNRMDRLLREREDLTKVLEDSRERVGVDPTDMQHVVSTALARIGFDLGGAEAGKIGSISTFAFDPQAAPFTQEAGWADIFDDLRIRRRKKGEPLNEWRMKAPLRKISFEPPIIPETSRDAADTVQVHLEHRLIRRLLSRFLSQGFQSGLSRFSVLKGQGAQTRVVLLARLALYGPGASRLHEEIIQITAIWSEVGRESKKLRPLGDAAENKTLEQLEHALRIATAAPASVIERVSKFVEHDITDLAPAVEVEAKACLQAARAQLAKRGVDEAASLRTLLQNQKNRILKATKDAEEKDTDQFSLPGVLDEERRERQADRRYWTQRLSRLEQEIANEPERIRSSYDVIAHRLEPVALIYLWPVTG